MYKFLLAYLLLGAIAMTTPAQNAPLPPALASLVDAERSFARTSVEKGVRTSFTGFFADGGLNFRPQPVNVKEDYAARPAPAGPQPFTLNWEPIYADISQAGDLGYTTGPVVITDKTSANKPPSYAYYFSVWKKQIDGNWKVILDFGTSTPDSVDATKDVSFHSPFPSNGKIAKTKRDLAAERLVLLSLERELSNVSVKQGVVAAYRDHLLDESRLHRNDSLPVVGKSEILQFFTERKVTPIAFELVNVGIASSADLAYTYGKYHHVENAVGEKLEQGHFLRVWKRDATGNWRIAADVAALEPKN